MKQFKPLEDQAKKNQKEIQNLKDELRHKKKMINTFQKALETPIFQCIMCKNKVSFYTN